MSTLQADTLNNRAGTKTVPVDTVIDGSAKAWVNFNGTGTVAIRASFNVSSITDNGTGDYTVNFTNALPDANYGWALGGSIAASFTVTGRADAAAPTASAFRLGTYTAAGAATDAAYVTAAFFR